MARIARNADRFSDNLTIKGEHLKPVAEPRALFAQDYAHFPEGERVEVQVPGIEDEFTK